MPTTDYDWNQTRNEIIERAFRLVGVLALGEVVSSDQHTQAVIAINDLVKQWQNDDIFLWTLREFNQTLSTSTASYSLSTTDPAVMWIDRAYLRTGSGTGQDDLLLTQIGWREYQDIANKNEAGDPTAYCLDNRISPTLYVWPVPTGTRTFHYLATVKLKDLEDASGNPDMTQRYLGALTYGLALLLGDEYGLPLGERRELEKRYQQQYRLARKADRERADFEFIKGAF